MQKEFGEVTDGIIECAHIIIYNCT
jgi:hypothetical protein